MGRPARRAKQTGSAAAMANRRDAGMVRDMQYNQIDKLINPAEVGPGSGSPDRIQLNMARSTQAKLSDYSMVFIQVMYVDLIAPSPATVNKLKELAALAQDISKDGAARKSADAKRTFSLISRQINKAARTLENQLHFENTVDEMKVRLYDLILYFLEEHRVTFEGLLPSM